MCVNCSRPSTSIFASQLNDEDNVSGKSSELDKLLDRSNIDDAELSDEITKGSITEEQMPTFSKTRKRLYTQRMHDTPVVESMSSRKRKRPFEIQPLPSSQEFVSGLRDVGNPVSSQDGEISGLTSTQNLEVGSDSEEEIASPRQSQRLKDKGRLDWSHLKDKPTPTKKGKHKRRNSEPEDHLEEGEDEWSQELEDRGNSKVKEYSKKKNKSRLASSEKRNYEKKSPKKSEGNTPSQKISLDRSKSRENQDILPSQSQNLLERHLEDQMNFRESQVDTENLVDALNNIDEDNPPTDGIVTPPVSPVVTSTVPTSPKPTSPMPTSPVPTSVTPVKKQLRHGLFETRSDRLETNTKKLGRFCNQGEFSANFRLPYSSSEEKAMVDFFINEGGYRIRKGRHIWRRMESMKICNGRTWQSMKGRWEKHISKDLMKFNVSHSALIEADKRIYGDDGDDELPENDGASMMSVRSNFRGVRSGRRFYTREEDIKIINFLLENRRYSDVGGNSVWQVIFWDHSADIS